MHATRVVPASIIGGNMGKIIPLGTKVYFCTFNTHYKTPQYNILYDIHGICIGAIAV